MTISVQLSHEDERRLDYLASQTGRSKDYYLREVIERGLAEVEDYYLAIDVLERVHKGEEPVYSAAEVKEYLELDD